MFHQPSILVLLPLKTASYFRAMSNLIDQIEAIATRWTRINERIFARALNRLGVGITDELKQSIRSEVRKATDQVVAEHQFLVRGRFRDMGAGRGTKANSRSRNLADGRQSKRKPAKWYSRPFYGRLNDLYGVVGAQVSEQIIEKTRQALHQP